MGGGAIGCILVVVGLDGGTGGLAGGAGTMDVVGAAGIGGTTPDFMGGGTIVGAAAANDVVAIAVVPMGTAAAAAGLVDLVPLG